MFSTQNSSDQLTMSMPAQMTTMLGEAPSKAKKTKSAASPSQLRTKSAQAQRAKLTAQNSAQEQSVDIEMQSPLAAAPVTAVTAVTAIPVTAVTAIPAIPATAVTTVTAIPAAPVAAAAADVPATATATAVALQSAQSIAPTASELDAFKSHVNTYIEADNEIKKLKKTLGAFNAARKETSKTILEFMQRHNIDDLNTRHGTIRYKITKFKQPMSHASIKTKMVAVYNADISVNDLVRKVFEERPTVERGTLRRLTNAAAGSTD